MKKEDGGKNNGIQQSCSYVDRMLLAMEQLIRFAAGSPSLSWDSVKIGECDGCKWRDRHQKCACCRRNRGLKENYEEE
jgi:hypothetical protein